MIEPKRRQGVRIANATAGSTKRAKPSRAGTAKIALDLAFVNSHSPTGFRQSRLSL